MGFSRAYISQLARHGAPAVWHDRTEPCVPVQKQVTLGTSLPVSGLEMVCSALLLSQPPFSLPFSLSKLSLQRDSYNWDSRASVASSSCPRGLLFSGTLTSLKDVSGRDSRCVWLSAPGGGGAGCRGGGGVAWKPASVPPWGHPQLSVQAPCELGMDSTGSHSHNTPESLAHSRSFLCCFHQPIVR